MTFPEPEAVAFVQFEAAGGGGQRRPAGLTPPSPDPDGGGGQHGPGAEALVTFIGGSGGQHVGGPRGPVVLAPETFVAPVPFVGAEPQQVGGGGRWELLVWVEFADPLPAPVARGGGAHGGAVPDTRVSDVETAIIEPTSTIAATASTWVLARASAAGILVASMGPLREKEGGTR